MVLNIFAKSLKLAIRVAELVLLVISAENVVRCMNSEIAEIDIAVQECLKEYINMLDMRLHYLLAHFSLF